MAFDLPEVRVVVGLLLASEERGVELLLAEVEM